MPVTMLMQSPAIAAELYDALNTEMDMSEQNLPEGLLHHFATKTDDGFVIFDVWESREDFERFINERLMPAMQKVAEEEPPRIEPTYGQLHNELHG